MELTFDNEEIIVKGLPVRGNIVVRARGYDASFTHEMGTEYVADVEFTLETFEHISGWLPGMIDYVWPALEAWLAANEARIEKRFDDART